MKSSSGRDNYSWASMRLKRLVNSVSPRRRDRQQDLLRMKRISRGRALGQVSEKFPGRLSAKNRRSSWL